MGMTGRNHLLLVMALFSVGLSVACRDLGASAAEQGDSLGVPSLPPAIAKRLEKAAADLEKMREEAGGKASAPQAAQEKDKLSNEIRGQLRGMLQDELRQAGEIEVDDEDMDGLEQYTRGQYDQAAALFEKSLSAKPIKEFPTYFLGCIAFEQGEYGQAAGRFQKVYEQNKTCTSAYFLSILSDLCARHPQPVAPLDMALLAKEAAARADKELRPPEPEDATMADTAERIARSYISHATEGPMIVRCREASAPILLVFR